MTREEIEEATQQYLAMGGKITRYPAQDSFLGWEDIQQMLERVVGGIEQDNAVVAQVIPNINRDAQ